MVGQQLRYFPWEVNFGYNYQKHCVSRWFQEEQGRLRPGNINGWPVNIGIIQIKYKLQTCRS